jgi:phage gpG-like protein
VSIANLARRLARLDLAAVRQAALAAAAETIAAGVREALSQPPGGDHRFPSRQTGELADSIGVSADADEALVGSTSEIALYQERGTATVPPRPFFSVIAADHAEAAAEAVGAAVAAAIRGA